MNFDTKRPTLVDYCVDVYSKSLTYPATFKLVETRRCYYFQLGSDPLDYIYIFQNEEDKARGIPRHWHYIGFGLTDIYGFGNSLERYPPTSGIDRLSGFGYELTFRLKSDSHETSIQDAPMWPCEVMQKIARYNFNSKLVFKEGDNLSWHKPLAEEDSRIQDFLMTIDPQLTKIQTPYGKVKFIQLVGVCRDELEAAKASSVNEILDILRENSETGGTYLVTDMRRGHTIFEFDPSNRKRVLDRINGSGSDMVCISAKHKYSSSEPKWFRQEIDSTFSSVKIVDEYEDNNSPPTNQNPYGIERGTFSSTFHDVDSSHCIQQDNQSRNPSRMSYESESGLMLENLELAKVRFYDNLYLLLTYESASMLPVILRRRLKLKQTFTYQSWEGDLTTTLVPEGSQIKSLVRKERPFVRQGVLLQIFISNELLDEMIETLKIDFEDKSGSFDQSAKKSDLKLPKNYSWKEFGLHLTVVDKIRD